MHWRIVELPIDILVPNRSGERISKSGRTQGRLLQTDGYTISNYETIDSQKSNRVSD